MNAIARQFTCDSERLQFLRALEHDIRLNTFEQLFIRIAQRQSGAVLLSDRQRDVVRELVDKFPEVYDRAMEDKS